MGAHGWVAGIASHGSVSLSRGWLISVEAPRHPGHPSSIQLDAVVNRQFLFFTAFGVVPFLKDILGRMLPMMGMAKQDNLRWVIANCK